MEIIFKLDEDESKITPIKFAETLIRQKTFSRIECEELSEYLSVYAKYSLED